MYSETWPDSGTMRNGCVFERLTSERPISESESSSWPTAQAHDAGGPRGNTMADHHYKDHDLVNAAQNWPTTRATSGGGNTSAYPGAPYRPALAQLAGSWSTASAHDGRRPGSDATSTQGANLKRDAETWATPDANRSSYSNGVWQTPQARDYRSGESLKDYGNTRPLNEQVLSLPAPLIPDGPQFSESDLTSLRRLSLQNAANAPKMRLNPQFVEWLMGFPIGWSKP